MDGCIFIGAQSFPQTDFLPHPAFASAKKEISSYVQSATGLSLTKDRCLDLFDSELSSLDQLERMLDFVKQLKAWSERGPTELLVYYVGHGQVTPKDDDLFWVLNSSKSATGTASCLSVKSLASSIAGELTSLRLFFIVDCCFSGAAAKLFMNGRPMERALQKVDAVVGPQSGVAFLCSSSSEEVSFVLEDGSSTVFTRSLMNVLESGDGLEPEEELISLQRLHIVCSAQIKKAYGPTRPTPFLVDPRQEGLLISQVKKFRPMIRKAMAAASPTEEVRRYAVDPVEKVLAYKLHAAANALVPSFIETIRHVEVVRSAYALNWRCKSANGVIDKVKRRVEADGKSEYSVSSVTDVVGIRVACLFQSELLDVVSEIAELISGKSKINPNALQADEVSEVIVYTTDATEFIGTLSARIRRKLETAFSGSGHNPKIDIKYAQSYSSVHIVLFREVMQDGEPLRLPVEIQLRTVFEDAWAQVDHKLRYVSQRVKHSPAVNNSVSHERHLVTLKKLLDVASEYCETILDEVNSKEKPTSQTIIAIDGRNEFRAMAEKLGVPDFIAEEVDALLVRKDAVDSQLKEAAKS
jgi:ppGpp synthetase/RelA/SpoT-type nucleotidyltranferase